MFFRSKCSFFNKRLVRAATKNIECQVFSRVSKKLLFGIFGRANLDYGTQQSHFTDKYPGKTHMTVLTFGDSQKLVRPSPYQ